MCIRDRYQRRVRGSNTEHMPSESTTEYTLHYFNGMGAVEPARILFAIAKQPYTDHRFPLEFGVPGDFSTIKREEFDQAKASGELVSNLGRAPVLTVDGVSFGQSKTILRFLAGAFGLFGADELSRAKIDTIMEHVADFKDGFGKAAPPFIGEDKRSKEEADEAMAGYWKGLEGQLEALEAYIGESEWCGGEEISVADVLLFSFFSDNGRVQACSQLQPTLEKFSKIREIVDKVAAHEQVAGWLASRPQTPF
eukprot:TRINITY_DN1046_c0_g1_i9.p1 TRINITY_DN1046_c0_g1~~TRINITY_DN1046_c0_g1_i9.p1  ORF type:complete len:252 (+),score=97.05 TRINITY_DN1046_c0_g1_i9:168-923(+)